MSHVGFLVFIVLYSFIKAYFEVQIEGRHGWAEKLPTWKWGPNKYTRIFMGDRPLTGYHCGLWSVEFLLPLFPFIGGLVEWEWRFVFAYFSLLLLAGGLEDYLWAKFNGLEFNKNNLPWFEGRWIKIGKFGFPSIFIINWIFGPSFYFLYFYWNEIYMSLSWLAL